MCDLRHGESETIHKPDPEKHRHDGARLSQSSARPLDVSGALCFRMEACLLTVQRNKGNFRPCRMLWPRIVEIILAEQPTNSWIKSDRESRVGATSEASTTEDRDGMSRVSVNQSWSVSRTFSRSPHSNRSQSAWAEFGVADSVPDVPVPKKFLDEPGIETFVGEEIARRMA